MRAALKAPQCCLHVNTTGSEGSDWLIDHLPVCGCRASLKKKLDKFMMEVGPAGKGDISMITIILKALEENEHEYL